MREVFRITDTERRFIIETLDFIYDCYSQEDTFPEDEFGEVMELLEGLQSRQVTGEELIDALADTSPHS